jgi:hypothetical protein
MTQQAPTKIIVDPTLVQRADMHCPRYMPRTVFLNVLIEEGLDSRAKLDERPSRPQAGSPTEGESPSKAVNKRNKEKEIPGNLWGHADLIRAYWTAKPKTKTDAAWKLLMTELAKIQDGYGDAALRTQLELAEANRWQGITLANYERFGLPKGNGPAQSGGVDWEAIDKMGPLF